MAQQRTRGGYRETKNFIVNSHGLRISKKNVNELRRRVNAINSKLNWRIKRATELNPSRSFLDKKTDTFFNVNKKSQNLNNFKTQAEFKRYMNTLERQSQANYINRRIEIYRENYKSALRQGYNIDSRARYSIQLLNRLSTTQFEKLVTSGDLPTLNIHYWGTGDDLSRLIDLLESELLV